MTHAINIFFGNHWKKKQMILTFDFQFKAFDMLKVKVNGVDVQFKYPMIIALVELGIIVC